MRRFLFHLSTRAVVLLGIVSTALGETVDPHQMLRNWLTQIAMKQLAARREKIEAIQTPAEVRQRSREVREALLRMIGGLPKERSALNLRQTGVIDRGDYRVEKIIFESSPKEYVTANLYVPQTGKPPYPAVLHPVGHSTAAKVRAFYQTLSLGLVKSGYVVLTYDPPGQGERRLFYDSALQDSKVGGGTLEHSIVGIQSLLAGESVARYMVWDGIRGVDLLASRPEVDPQRIGVAGCSGGGTLTAYLAVLDDRLRVAAPACYITNWEDQLVGTGPQDAEQQFPDFLLNGFNHGDLIIAAAPKPYLMCNTERDFFPIEGARKTYAEVKRIYGRLGMEDRIAWAVGPGGHGMPKNVREAIYGWMNHWLKGTVSTQASEPEFQTEYEEVLLSTPTGQLSTSLGGENVSSLNLKRYASLPPAFNPPEGPADLESLRKDMRRKVLSLTRYQPSTGALGVTEQPPTQRSGYRMTRLTYQADGRTIPALLAIPETGRSRQKVLLYLDQLGRAESEKLGGDFDQFAQAGYTILAPDPSGIGETNPKWASYSDSWLGSDKTTWLALMVGRPLVGIRMDDILRGIDLLSERHLLRNGGCAGFAKGLPAVDLLFAATVDDRLRALDLEGGPVSYASMARTPIQRRVFDVVIPDILHHMDLPELAAAMAPRRIRLRNLRSPLGVIEPIAKARKEYVFAAEVYQVTGTGKNFDIGLRREDETATKAYPD